MHEFEALHLTHHRYPNGSILAYSSQVVSKQIDDHHILGAILRRRRQLGNAGGVFLGSLTSRPRSLNGTGLDPGILDAKEPFGRRAGDSEIPEVKISREWRRIEPPKPFVQIEWKRFRRCQQSLRDICLKTVARVDKFDGATDRFQICFAAEIAGNFRSLWEREPGREIECAHVRCRIQYESAKVTRF